MFVKLYLKTKNYGRTTFSFSRNREKLKHFGKLLILFSSSPL